jgi:hypothetical protein
MASGIYEEWYPHLPQGCNLTSFHLAPGQRFKLLLV